jgi:hypothetical protein
VVDESCSKTEVFEQLPLKNGKMQRILHDLPASLLSFLNERSSF